MPCPALPFLIMTPLFSSARSSGKLALAAAVIAGFTLSSLPVSAQADRSSESETRQETKRLSVEEYLRLISRHLPEGVTLQNANTAQLVAAVVAAINAQPHHAAGIAGAIATVATNQQIQAIAHGIGGLFKENPIVRNQAPDIALAMAISIEAKPEGLESRATVIGEVSSTLIYYFDPSSPQTKDLLSGVVTNVLGVNAEVVFSDIVVEIILRMVKAIGFPDEYLTQLYADLGSRYGNNGALLSQIANAIGKIEGELNFPPFPTIPMESSVTGPVSPTESPAVNF